MMYVLTMTTPKVDDTIVGATPCHKTAERMARELHIDLLKQAGVTDEEIEACDNLNDLHPEIFVSVEHTQVTPPDGEYSHPIYRVIEQIASVDDLTDKVMERWDLEETMTYAKQQLEDHYENNRDRYIQDVIEFGVLDIEEDPEEPSDEDALSPEELKEFGDKYNVKFAPEDARHPLVYAVWQED
jgi:hypothetical protein